MIFHSHVKLLEGTMFFLWGIPKLWTTKNAEKSCDRCLKSRDFQVLSWKISWPTSRATSSARSAGWGSCTWWSILGSTQRNMITQHKLRSTTTLLGYLKWIQLFSKIGCVDMGEMKQPASIGYLFTSQSSPLENQGQHSSDAYPYIHLKGMVSSHISHTYKRES
jgi:hypothetical protein